MILLQTSELTNAALKVSPFNAAAYGILVAILIFAVIALWREIKKEQAYSKQLSEKVIELMTRIDLGMDADKEVKKILVSEWPSLKASIEGISQLIHNKLSK